MNPTRGRSAYRIIISLMIALLGFGWAAASSAAESDIRGPDVTIIVEEDKTIHELRQGGQLRMVRVVP